MKEVREWLVTQKPIYNMNYKIEADHRKILDLILPFFELNEVLNVNKSIRKSFIDNSLAIDRMPINLYSDIIKEFLIKNKYAKSLAGDAVINRKGLALKSAGSLLAFEGLKFKRQDFIVIDDDSVNNLICKNLIHVASPTSEIKTFTDPNSGLRYMYSRFFDGDANDVVLLLDINMPTLLGWDVLEEYNSFPETIKARIRIFMLSSSIDQKDIIRAENDVNVWGFIEKPLTQEKVKYALLYD
jgi:CheY-like chemotaxis protein